MKRKSFETVDAENPKPDFERILKECKARLQTEKDPYWRFCLSTTIGTLSNILSAMESE